jgi:hypothetical protein
MHKLPITLEISQEISSFLDKKYQLTTTSVPHLEASTPDLEKNNDASLCKGGCMFVDNATGWVHTVHQTSLTSHETLSAKEKFEFACQDYGVLIQGYKAD